jgi:hypothetical protein
MKLLPLAIGLSSVVRRLLAPKCLGLMLRGERRAPDFLAPMPFVPATARPPRERVVN